MAEHGKILYSVSEGIARVTLNRPEKRNALDAQMIAELKDALAAAMDTRVVLLRGAGADFCSGADLAALSRENGILEGLAYARSIGELFVQMRRHPRPIVAAVTGRALAGGCGLATACDIVLAAESAQFGYPEVNIGLVPAIVMAILRRSVPEKRAFELIAGGEAIGAPAALEAGLINRVFPDTEFEDSVSAWISKLAAKSASAISLSKRLLYHMDAMAFESAIEAGVEVNAIARMTDDCRRGLERFLKK